MKIGDSSVRWMPVHNIHLTLKFLGDVSSEKVDSMIHIVQSQADSHPAFDVQIGGLGTFPSSKRPRVLFIGIQAPAELGALQRGFEAACTSAGFRSDSRLYSPHLTIGRVRRGITPAEQMKIKSALDGTKIDSLGSAGVDLVHLYRSELKPTGSVYTKLFSAPLKTQEVKTESTRPGTQDH